MANEHVENSPLADLVRGILADYLGNRVTKKMMNEAATRIIKGVLMTREGANLPEKGTATNFSDAEVAGKNDPEKLSETSSQTGMGRRKVLADSIKAEKEKIKKEGRTRAVIATPGFGEPGTPEEVAPIAINTRE